MYKYLALILLTTLPAWTQIVSHGKTAASSSVFDFSGAGRTAPNKTGTALPGTCTVGDTFFDTDDPAGQNLYACTATNTWTLISGVIIDLKATKTSSTVVNFAAGKANFGATTYAPVAGSITITAGTGSGTAKRYLSSSGAVVIEHPTAAGVTITCSNCTQSQVTTPAVPNTAIHLDDITITSGAWDTVTDKRGMLSTLALQNGTGMNSTHSSGVWTLAIDTATVPLLGGNNSFTGDFDAGSTTLFRVRKGSADPATCTADQGELFYNTTSDLLKHCSATNTWTSTAGGSGFDPLDQTKAILWDEMCAGRESNGGSTFGTMSWRLANITGAGTLTAIDGVANRPCITQITTATAANDEVIGTSNRVNESGISPMNVNNWEAKFIVRPSVSTSVRHEVGFTDTLGVLGANRIVVKWDTADSDTVWKFQACSASTCTTASSTIAAAANTWARLRIRSTTSGTILFSVDGETEVSVATNVPTVALRPIFGVRTRTTSAASIDLDWFAFQWTGLSR